MWRRLFGLISAFAVLFFCSVPALATGMAIGGGGAGIPIVGNINLDVVEFAEYVRDDLRWDANAVWHLIDEDVCPYAPQLGGQHQFQAVRTMNHGQIGLYYQCQYCGRNYGDMLDEAYQDYVDTLPGTQCNSDGAFLWVPDVSYFDGDSCSFVWRDSGQSSCTVYFRDNFQIISGSYAVTLFLRDALVLSGRGARSVLSSSATWPKIVRVPWTARYVSANGCLNVSFDSIVQSGGFISDSGYSRLSSPSLQSSAGTFDLYFLWPQFWVTPFEVQGSSGVGSSFSSDVRSIDASGSGLYGYIGGDGTLYQSTVGTIYNETMNVYQNPVTGDTSGVTNWSYDYIDRSYTLTTDEGDTVTVTYGDENITINDAGTTYNVYYLMEEPEIVCEEPVHIHDYSSSVTASPTCVAPGVRTYVCSDCGDSSTESIPAIGHSFSASRFRRKRNK